jgi:putative FmdB family regulatory protein
VLLLRGERPHHAAKLTDGRLNPPHMISSTAVSFNSQRARMPTYEYRCPEGHQFEKFQKITEKPRAKCPVCGKRGDPVISGGAGLVFRERLLHHRLRQGRQGPGSPRTSRREKPAEKKSETAAEGDQEGRATARKPSPSERRDPAELARVAASLGPTASTSCSSGPATRPRRPGHQPRHGPGPPRADQPAQVAERVRGACACPRAGRPTEIAGPASSTSGSPETSSPARATHPDGGSGLRPLDRRRGSQGQRRVRLRQSHRTAPRRSRPRRRLGDAIATLLEWTGHAVTREFYINDAGSQIDNWPRVCGLASARRRAAVRDSRGGYHGEYLRENARRCWTGRARPGRAERADGSPGAGPRHRLQREEQDRDLASSVCISTC